MTHYDTLDVPVDASTDEIKQAFRRKASAAHPDKGGTDAAMTEINRAYAVLGDAQRREQYDENGDDKEPTTPAEKAIHHLAGLFNTHLMAEGDILQAMRAELAGDKKSATWDIASLGCKVEQLTRRRGKVRVKSGENLMHLLIDGQIDQANAQTRHLQDMLQVFDCTATLLAQYESTEETRPDAAPGLEDLLMQAFKQRQDQGRGNFAEAFAPRW